MVVAIIYLCKVVIYNYILCWLYSMTKKCCNCINFVPCILWNFIVLGLVLSWWRIKHAMKINAILWLTRKKLASKGSRKKAMKKHMLEAEESITRLYFARQDILRGTRETLCLEDFKCDFLTLHLYYIYPHYLQKLGETIQRENPK